MSGTAGALSRRADAPRYGGVMGFNPFRAQARRSTDYVVVAVALVVIAALVLWALFG